MTRTRIFRSLGVWVATWLLGYVGAQQPNTPSSTATWGGNSGPPWPIAALVDVSVTGAVALDMAGGPLMPLALAESPGGLQIPGTATPFGLLDLSPAGLVLLADGIGLSTGTPLDPIARIGPTGSAHFALPIWPPANPVAHPLQSVVTDPSSPGGFTFTAATSLVLYPVPVTAVFVSALTGAPGNPGTQAEPLSSIGAAIAAAAALPSPHPPVIVAAGNRRES